MSKNKKNSKKKRQKKDKVSNGQGENPKEVSNGQGKKNKKASKKQGKKDKKEDKTVSHKTKKKEDKEKDDEVIERKLEKDYSSMEMYSSDHAGFTSNIDTILNIIGLVVIGLCVFSVGFISGKVWNGFRASSSTIYKIIGKKEDQEVTKLDFDLFWKVWNDLSTGYVDPDLDEEKMYYGAIKGMVSGVGDPVTVFLTPEETQQYKDNTAGKFEGVGMELGYKDNDLVVVVPLEGSPAKAAGIRAGDKIISVDGESIVGKNIFDVVMMIRGEKGTEVAIEVKHESANDTDEIKITRDEITVPSLDLEKMEGDIAVVDVDRFSEVSLEAWQARWDEIMKEVQEKNPEAIILDLRGNPGGYFDAAIWAGGEFLDEGTIIAKQRNRNGQEILFKVNRDGNLKNIELVVLVDENSASASEILAGALQHYNRAYLIGESTYGKGTAQEIIGYEDGSSLHITTLNWVLPNDEILDRENVVKPDKTIELEEKDFKEGEDPQMDAAIEYLNSN
jgi:carboxyl-terminal processing protease